MKYIFILNSFSAVSALESYYYNVTGKKVSFSEQQLVDCVYAQDGCNGGLNDDAFNFGSYKLYH